MDTLRIILIILGIVVIVGIYLWDKSHKNDLPGRVPHQDPEMDSDEEDAPSLVITTETKYNEEDLASELADLNFFMGNRTAENTQDDELFNEIRIPANTDEMDDIDEGRLKETDRKLFEEVEEQDGIEGHENIAHQDVRQENTSEASEHIIVLHVLVDEDKKINGDDLQKVTASSGFEFGEMNIFHYRNVGLSGEAQTIFSLVNMFEPGNFEPEKMDTFTTQGVSLFAMLKNDGSDLNAFDTMLVITRQIAKQLGGEILGPDKTPLSDDAVEEIIQKLKEAA